jgi:hypothetical protein
MAHRCGGIPETTDQEWGSTIAAEFRGHSIQPTGIGPRFLMGAGSGPAIQH